MPTGRVSFELPLLVTTPDLWAEEVLREPEHLLNDHAHLEKKAAQNALELLHRWPEPCPPENWVVAMTAVAKKAIIRKTGARGLRSIMESILLDTMFELPGLRGVDEVVINAEVVDGNAKPLYVHAKQVQPNEAS